MPTEELFGNFTIARDDADHFAFNPGGGWDPTSVETAGSNFTITINPARDAISDDAPELADDATLMLTPNMDFWDWTSG